MRKPPPAKDNLIDKAVNLTTWKVEHKIFDINEKYSRRGASKLLRNEACMYSHLRYGPRRVFSKGGKRIVPFGGFLWRILYDTKIVKWTGILPSECRTWLASFRRSAGKWSSCSWARRATARDVCLQKTAGQVNKRFIYFKLNHTRWSHTSTVLRFQMVSTSAFLFS